MTSTILSLAAAKVLNCEHPGELLHQCDAQLPARHDSSVRECVTLQVCSRCGSYRWLSMIASVNPAAAWRRPSLLEAAITEMAIRGAEER
jgi:hypothetical protein